MAISNASQSAILQSGQYGQKIYDWALSAPINQLLDPNNYVGMTPIQLGLVANALEDSGDGRVIKINEINAAQVKGNPAGMAEASKSTAGGFGSWSDFRDAVEGTTANFIAPAATMGLSSLANNVWSEGAQKSIEPGLQTVSGIAGAGAQYGAKHPQTPSATGTSPTNLAGTTNGGMSDPVFDTSQTPSWGGNTNSYISPELATTQQTLAGATPEQLALGGGALAAANNGGGGGGNGGGGGSPSFTNPDGSINWGGTAQNLLPLVPNLLGIAGANEASDKQDALSREYMAMGAPYRGKLAELYNNPEAYLATQRGDIEKNVQRGTDIMSRSLSMGGNPIGSGNALQQLQSYASEGMDAGLYGRLDAERKNMANFGGLSQFNSAAPQAGQNAIDAGSKIYDAYGAAGSTLNDIFGTKKKSSYDKYLESITR